MKIVTIIFAALSLSACRIEDEAETERSRQAEIKKGEIRHQLFIECMELAAKNPRIADDKVSKIVDSCTESSYYISNSMVVTR